MTFRFNRSFAIFLALSLGVEGCTPKSSGFPLDVRTIDQLTSDNTAQISYEESSDDILVTIIDKAGDSHVHQLIFAGMSRQRALEILRHKQQLLGLASQPPVNPTLPFETVVVSGSQIVGTLPSQPRFFIQEGVEKPRLLAPAESLKLEAGIPIRLFERHVSFLVTAQTAAPAGIRIQRTDDAFGEGATQSYFVPAR